MSTLLNASIGMYPIYSIVWNFILALIPCALVYALAKAVGHRRAYQLKNSQSIAFVLIFGLWLLFLPNTTYLFASIRYLLDYCQPYNHVRVCMGGQNLWMVMFFFLYALAGLPLFVYSLERMTKVVGQLFGKRPHHFFPIFVIPLAALGTLFGVVERFSSWDLFLQPLTVPIAGLLYFFDLTRLLNLGVFTLGLYLLYYGTLYLWEKRPK
ncbi:MAG: DUF1361 domain-containing protein [Candidatus Peregrinibacteria bacterium]